MMSSAANPIDAGSCPTLPERWLAPAVSKPEALHRFGPGPLTRRLLGALPRSLQPGRLPGGHIDLVWLPFFSEALSPPNLPSADPGTGSSWIVCGLTSTLTRIRLETVSFVASPTTGTVPRPVLSASAAIAAIDDRRRRLAGAGVLPDSSDSHFELWRMPCWSLIIERRGQLDVWAVDAVTGQICRGALRRAVVEALVQGVERSSKYQS